MCARIIGSISFLAVSKSWLEPFHRAIGLQESIFVWSISGSNTILVKLNCRLFKIRIHIGIKQQRHALNYQAETFLSSITRLFPTHSNNVGSRYIISILKVSNIDRHMHWILIRRPFLARSSRSSGNVAQHDCLGCFHCSQEQQALPLLVGPYTIPSYFLK